MNSAHAPQTHLPDKSERHTRLVLVRHGETPWNAEKRFQGHTDIGLNDRGLQQARSLGAYLRHDTRILQNTNAAYCSDLTRARLTAEILLDTQLAPVSRTDLRERDYGHFSGMTAEEMAAHDPAQYQALRDRIPDRAISGGESLLAFYDRIKTAMACILNDHPGQQVMLVAHGGVLDCVYRMATQTPLQTTRTWLLPNCALNILDAEHETGELQIRLWADLNHLKNTEQHNIGDEVDGRVA